MFSCIQRDKNNGLESSEWRYYFNSESYDWIKFRENDKVEFYSAEAMSTSLGTYVQQEHSVYIFIDSTYDGRIRKCKYELEYQNRKLNFQRRWDYDEKTKSYTLSDYIFDKSYDFEKNTLQ